MPDESRPPPVADPLLRHLTVPRFRLPDLSIDVPVVLNGLTGASTSSPPPDRATLHGIFETIVFEAIEKGGSRLTKAILRVSCASRSATPSARRTISPRSPTLWPGPRR